MQVKRRGVGANMQRGFSLAKVIAAQSAIAGIKNQNSHAGLIVTLAEVCWTQRLRIRVVNRIVVG